MATPQGSTLSTINFCAAQILSNLGSFQVSHLQVKHFKTCVLFGCLLVDWFFMWVGENNFFWTYLVFNLLNHFTAL
jgi:hypothetical protein